MTSEKSERPQSAADQDEIVEPSASRLLVGLSWLDRLLPLNVFLAMVIGIVIGKFAGNTEAILEGATLDGVSILQYEALPEILRTAHLWRQVLISIVLNWIVAPFIMLGIAYATLPDQPTYRTGVLMVGLARCIAMVMIWNQLARGDTNYCAILVIINSILQIALYSPMSLFFVNVISKEHTLRLEYGKTAIAVLIYLGIPLVAGVVTRFTMLRLLGRKRFEGVFLTWFGPLALIGLLYTIIIICSQQATRILDNIGVVFRVFVPMILYFVVMWTGVFVAFWYMNRRHPDGGYGYPIAVVQSFTAASNNFELAIAVCVAVYGVNSDEALAATIGPLVEVPVLLLLTYVSLKLRKVMSMPRGRSIDRTLPPTRSLTAQRDYRARKVAKQRDLEDSVAQLTAENAALRAEVADLRARVAQPDCLVPSQLDAVASAQAQLMAALHQLEGVASSTLKPHNTLAAHPLPVNVTLTV
ncbi:uncharacterized protein EHS24_005530 [Apiotrichum porosum]|uniref:BZIP domain-containing protein n=1 Tax=Apiotrichum porosum TaxID=105984 RepID=A0A427XCD2_9TREE|nr:uncharacterized protein EHS24_005530 [Apiotrichum porosum]RSH76541.1 hypothetical protein EHS24_005530 [Apiotrichum porosum]